MRVYYKKKSYYNKPLYEYVKVKYCCDKMQHAATVDLSRGYFFCGDIEWNSEDCTIYFDTAGGEYGSSLTDVKYCPFCGASIEMIKVD